PAERIRQPAAELRGMGGPRSQRHLRVRHPWAIRDASDSEDCRDGRATTGLVDPTVEVRPTEGQIDDLLAEVKKRTALGQRSLVTTLTKRFAEDLADYLREYGVKVRYLHSELDAMERIEVLTALRTGEVE